MDNETRSSAGSEKLPPENKKAPHSVAKVFSVAAASFAVSYIIMALAEAGISILLEKNRPSGVFSPDSPGMMLFYSLLPIYLVGIPTAYFMLRVIPRGKISPRRLSAKALFGYFALCFPFIFLGRLIGSTFMVLISGENAENPVSEAVAGGDVLSAVLLVAVSPVAEELIFRKCLLDRIAGTGKETAVLFSALCFALYHMNPGQFFYTFGMGLVLGYVYVKSARIIYPIIIHMMINLYGSVVYSAVIAAINFEKLRSVVSLMSQNSAIPDALVSEILPGVLAIAAYYLLYLVLVGIGAVLIVFSAKKDRLKENTGHHLNIRAFINPGMVFFLLVSVAFTLKAMIFGM